MTKSTVWCSEIGSLTSMMHATQVHLMTAENQFHCTKLYIRGRVCNSRSFCYGCCHGRISSLLSPPTSVCPKKGNIFILERWAERWHCTSTNTCMQGAGPARTASQNDRAFKESEHARVQRWVHNGLKREWLCVIDDGLRILPWQTPKYGVAYSSSYVLLLRQHTHRPLSHSMTACAQAHSTHFGVGAYNGVLNPFVAPSTVKPVQSSQPLVQTKAVFLDRWSLFAGSIHWCKTKWKGWLKTKMHSVQQEIFVRNLISSLSSKEFFD